MINIHFAPMLLLLNRKFVAHAYVRIHVHKSADVGTRVLVDEVIVPCQFGHCKRGGAAHNCNDMLYYLHLERCVWTIVWVPGASGKGVARSEHVALASLCISLCIYIYT